MEELEVWKDIPGYEGAYQISNAGRIKSLSRPATNCFQKNRKIKERINSAHLSKTHMFVILRKDGVRKQVYLHILLMLVFVGPMPEGCNVVMHLDDDPTNNNLSNLKYGSQSENIQSSYDKGRRSAPWTGIKGEANPGSKPIQQLSANGEMVSRYSGIAEAARQTHIPRTSISYALREKRIVHGFLWQYAA